MIDLENITNTIINGDCIEVMKSLPEGCIDLVVTSPPYSAGIKYDVYNDNTPMDEYWDINCYSPIIF
jgi:DNA modification methylase